MTKGDGAGSAASEWEEDDNTTDQSDQLMSRFSDILCFVLFSSSVPSFLLLGFWPEEEGKRGKERNREWEGGREERDPALSRSVFIPDSHWFLLWP